MTDEDLARASAMLAVERWADAASLLSQVIAAQPGLSRPWCLLARAHLGLGDPVQAGRAADRAVALAPSDEWPHRLASMALYGQRKYPEALRAAGEARRLAPHLWPSQVCLAQAAVAARKLDLAAEAAAAALEIAPEEPVVHVLAGKVRLAQGRRQEARWHQERALALDPAHSTAINELGRISLADDDAGAAADYFLQAAHTAPGEITFGRNAEIVLLRVIRRSTYLFSFVVAIAVFLPAVTSVPWVPYVIAVTLLAAAAAGYGWWSVRRLSAAARRHLRRMLRRPRLAAAFVVMGGGAIAAAGAAVLAVTHRVAGRSALLLGLLLVVALTAGTRALAARLLRGTAGHGTSPAGRPGR